MMVTTGIGFAIPSNHIKTILDEIMRNKVKQEHFYEQPKRRYLGVKTVTAEPHIIDRLKSDGLISYLVDRMTIGCVIIAVAPNSPAHK